ncbi:AAA family ATPase [Pseudarthrobacter sp. J75]|uniref:AAA family ATPase n=1 Tax=unclassified Pseudarthrobacter TaxID=2647000 RepID=UPI002E821B2C|nr:MULTISPECIES: AAA family ATPase [unclassified Pseudarthrobacter]MEE2521242.1 AAA family ATPase [Pseudarthrobacter sp. J47]MEE2528474.1 AAA family ATPase [Pseudarthrobacter sp. J75]
MPVWSRASRVSAEKKAVVSVGQGQTEGSEEFRKWLSGLKPVTGADTLLRFTKTPEGSIDLTSAHPSGLAQLMAGRRTRLSTLIRDRQQYVVAARASRNLRSKIFELGNDRGIDAGYFSAGTVVWTSAVGGKPQRVSAPVMLAGISLTVRPGEDDYELQLTEQASLNPALVRHLKNIHGIVFDVNTLTRMAYSTARFDPLPVLDRLSTIVAPIHGAEVQHNLLVSTFADLSGNLDDPWINERNPLVAALAKAAAGEAPAVEPCDPKRFPGVDERHPAEELLLLDADADQQYVLDAARAGESLVVSTPPGTGQTQTVINTIGTLVDAGKTVLVVGDRRASLNEVTSQLEGLGLDSAVLQLTGNGSPQQLKAQLVRAIVRNEKSLQPQLDNLHKTLTEHRHALVDHVSSLHNVRKRWGCSPYQAMQSLAELTSIHPAPATTVRLKRSVLDSIKDRAELAGRLKRAAELGSFSRSSTASPWHGARLLTRKETEEAQDLARSVEKNLPLLRDRMKAVAGHAEIRLGTTFAEWGEQLDLLIAVRESLDKFTPDIFDRPVHDLISATASSAWRRERNIEMASMQRSRLRRVAKEYVRPGVHIADLHSSLVLVQDQRALWADYATTQRHPAVPSGLAEINVMYRSLGRELASLGEALKHTSTGGNLGATPYDELMKRLEALVADTRSLKTLPERTLLVENMREHGLGELLTDLAEREVPVEAVAAELDLAWWQSVLEAMISGDDYLAMSDGDALRKLEAEYRLADNAHIASGAARLRWTLAERWRAAIAGEPKQAEQLRGLLKDGRVTLGALSALAPDMVSTLVPVWTVSPYLMTGLLPASQGFDAVVVVDAEATSLQAVLPAIARTKQVIAFGDDRIASPRTFTVGVERLAAGESAHQRVESAFTALSQVLPTWRLRFVYRAFDEDLVLQLSRNFYDDGLRRLPEGQTATGLDRSLLVEYLPDGTGLPSADHDGVESVVAEVNRVVELVFEHARLRPRTSLAVVTASLRHAARIGEAIRLQLPNHPGLSSFFSAGSESFRVVDLERAQGMVRDHVIFSPGFGRTPHGRALHSFGPLSAEGGRAKFALAMTRARRSMHVLSCFRPEDLDRTRLSHGAVDLFELLDREIAGNSDLGSPASRAAASEQALGADPLVADLGERLRARGARVWHQYDGVLDVAAAADPLSTMGKDDAEIPRPVAIESDGTERYRAMSVRERSRLRPQLLERLGWRYMPLWTIEVFTDPSSCADRIAGYLGLENVQVASRHGATGGYFDDDVDRLTLENAAHIQAAGQSTGLRQRPGRQQATGHGHYEKHEPARSVNEADEAGRKEDAMTHEADKAGTPATGTQATETRSTEQRASEPDASEAAGLVQQAPEAAGSAQAAGTQTPVPETQTPEPEASEAARSEQQTRETSIAELSARSTSVDGTPASGAPTAAPVRETPDTQGPAGESSSRELRREPVHAASVIPNKAAEDDPRRWGDTSDHDHDAWLREQKPPHWG